jgi:O-antigen/teichoic acid export membrane protein
MSLMQLLLKNIFWRGSYFFSVFVLNIVMARYFEAQVAGYIYYLSGIFSFLLLIGSICLETGMTFYGIKNGIAPAALGWLSIGWTIFATCVLVACLFFFYNNNGDYFNRQTTLLYAASYIFGILLTTFFATLFYAQKINALPNVILTVTNFLLIGYAIFLIKTNSFKHGGFTMPDAYFFIYTIQGILLSVAYFTVNKKVKGALLSKHSLLQITRYSLTVLFGNIIFFLVYRIDYWFVKNNCTVCDPADLGNYIQVSKIVQLFLVLPAMIASVLFPHTVAGNIINTQKNVVIITRAMLLLYLIAGVFLFFTGRQLFPFVFGKSFSNMYLPFLLLFPGLLALVISTLMAAYNGGIKKLSINIIGCLLALAVIVTGNVLFIPRYGINGAAVVSSVGYICGMLISVIDFCKRNRVAFSSFFIVKRQDILLIKAMIKKLKN